MSSTPRPSKTDVVTDFRRSQILDAARREFTAHGVSRTTMDGIARAAGVAKGTVYLYYESKDEILLQLVDHDLDELLDDTVPAVLAGGSIADRVRRFFAGTLGFFDRNRDFVDNCHFEMRGEMRKKTLQKYERVFLAQREAWERALGEAVAARTLPKQDIHTTANALVALAQGFAKQRLRGWTTVPVDALAERASAFALKGLDPS